MCLVASRNLDFVLLSNFVLSHCICFFFAPSRGGPPMKKPSPATVTPSDLFLYVMEQDYKNGGPGNTIFEFLPHWTDAVALGSVHPLCRTIYVAEGHRDNALEPVLEELETMVGSDKHQDCNKVYAPASKRTCTCVTDYPDREPDWHPESYCLATLDPRYKDDAYDELSLEAKCARMVHYISTIVSNMRRRLKFDDLANPDNLPTVIGSLNDWEFGDPISDLMIQTFPRRGALAFNLTLLRVVAGVIESGDAYNYEDALLGTGDIAPGGSSWGSGIVEHVIESFFPLLDEKMESGWKGVYPSPQTLALLGPILARKLILTAPLLESFPPSFDMTAEFNLEHLDDEVLDDFFGPATAPWEELSDSAEE